MLITVVIPTFNLLEDCIIALSPLVQNPSCEYEVIVSDDKEISETKKIINEKYSWAKWVEGPRRGAAANRNNGARYSKGDWVVFIDSDCIPDENLINSYVDAINKNPNILVFEGCIKADREKRHFLEESPVNESGGYFWSCNVMVNKEYFINSLKGFDEDFYIYQEDADLRERIKKDNQSIKFVKEAFVIHPWRLQRNPIKMAKLQLISYQIFCSKHPELISELSFTKYLKREFVFYIKNVLFKLITYRGRGVFKFVLAHIIANKFRNEKIQKELNTGENWTHLNK